MFFLDKLQNYLFSIQFAKTSVYDADFTDFYLDKIISFCYISYKII
ncbi:MAG TPA: hypothetical protein VI861_03335 [Rickettsiales bacterium]|nr:hypothetical protein [Rickettsiales bacterium]